MPKLSDIQAGLKSVASDAAESNAGDDFHLLWAARRSLKLLDIKSKLKAIRVEGPQPIESRSLDSSGTEFLGIDLSEYFGGYDFATATCVIHSQLKYSTRNPQQQWSVADICRPKTAGGSNSILRRLSQIFSAYAQGVANSELVAKLRIKLVSNRPVDALLLEVQHLVVGEQQKHNAESSYAQFKSTLRESLKKACEKLKDASQLDESDFWIFLQTLDFSECGVGARLDQELEIIRGLGQFGFYDASAQYRELIDLFRRRMMPEARSENAITVDDILAKMGIADRGELFPCPPRFAALEKPVPRLQMSDIGKTIIDANDRPVLIHGPAGMGKTTIAQMIERCLPRGSVAVVFDCYGAGSYLDPAEVRHGHSRAITQIANELAAETGSPLLLKRPQHDEDLLRVLKLRLEFAANVIAAQANDALVVIVIDAGDNSVSAAALRHDKSFVPDLLRCTLPKGVRLVVTGRSHCRKDLNPPSNVAEVELRPFELVESRANLRRVFPNASVPDEEEFHKLSNGVPRVQGYAIDTGSIDVARVLNALRPDGKTVERLIDQQISEAGRRCGSEQLIELLCRTVLALPRPVPISYVCLVSSCDEKAVQDFCIDLHQGLISASGLISFRDEDFENHLRSRFAPDANTYDTLATLFRDRADDEEYAASNLADVLLLAGKTAEVISLVLSGSQLRAIKDPVARQEAFARRSRLALEIAIRDGAQSTVVKLLFVVAEAAKVDEAVENLLLNNSDLACRFGDPQTVQRLYLSEKNSRINWHGPTHFLCAANFSRQEASAARAKEHLDSARAWLRHWMSKSDDERERWSFQAHDLANASEAILRIRGAQRAQRWLLGWGPQQFTLQASQLAIGSLLSVEGEKAFRLADPAMLRADVLAIAAMASADAGILPPVEFVKKSVTTWLRYQKRSKTQCTPLICRPGIFLCEAALFHKLEAQSIQSLLRFFTKAAPDHWNRFFGADVLLEWDAFLRAKAITCALESSALAEEDRSLLPKALQEFDAGKMDARAIQRHKEDVGEVKAFLRRLIPAYNLYARHAVGRGQPEQLPEELKAVLGVGGGYESGYGHHEADRIQARRLREMVLLDTLLRAKSHVQECFELLIAHDSKSRGRDLTLDIAAKCKSTSLLHAATLKIVDSVEKGLKVEAMPASELIAVLLRCSRTVARFDEALGRHYFELAVAAASEVDEEAMSLLKCLSELIQRGCHGAVEDRKNAIEFATIVESCYWRLEGQEHFPWNEAIAGIAALSPGVATLAIARWDQRDIIDFSEELGRLTAAGNNAGWITASTAIAFAMLAPLGSELTLKVSLDALGQLRAGTNTAIDALQIICDHVLRIAPLSARGNLGSQLLQWLANNSDYRTADVSAIEAMAEQQRRMDESRGVASAPAPSSFIDENTRRTHQRSTNIDLQAIAKRAFDNSCGGFENALRLFDEERKREKIDAWEGAPLRAQLLSTIKDAANVSDYVSQLESLLQIDGQLLHFEDLLAALKDRLSSWKSHPFVREWQSQLPSNLAKRRFDDFFFSDHLSSYQLRNVQENLGVSDLELCASLLLEMPKHIREVRARAVYELTAVLIASLTPPDARTVMQWRLSDLGRKMARKGLAVAGITSSDIPAIGGEIEASLLWYLFGHPDNRRRWLALHAARRCIRLGERSILQGLVTRLSKSERSSFVSPTTTFYWLAAKQSCLVMLDRIAEENATLLLPYAKILADQVLHPTPPHAIAMLFAKRTVLKLACLKPNPYTSTIITRVKQSLVPKVASKSQAKKKRQAAESYRMVGSARFRFDLTDTMPYWYEPLGRRFGVGAKEFCRLAEKFICDEWGFSGDAKENDPVKSWNQIRRNWSLASHRHGSPPTIEDLHIHLELHAMFCVAAELAKTLPILPPSWEDGDEWVSWLSRWDTAYRSGWLSDFRQATPIQSLFWGGEDLHGDIDPRLLKCEADFARHIGIEEPSHLGYIVTDGNFSRQDGYGSETVHIASALVPEQLGASLLHALAGSSDPHDYRIPWEGDELEIDERIGEVRFAFQGWVKHSDTDTEGIDAVDPLRNDMRASISAPGRELIKKLRLVKEAHGTSYCREGKAEPFSMFECWNDFPHRENFSGFASEGGRLWMRMDDIKAFLKKGKWSLVLSCEITERVSREARTSDEKDGTKTKLYLIKADGNIESVRGRDLVRQPYS